MLTQLCMHQSLSEVPAATAQASAITTPQNDPLQQLIPNLWLASCHTDYSRASHASTCTVPLKALREHGPCDNAVFEVGVTRDLEGRCFITSNTSKFRGVVKVLNRFIRQCTKNLRFASVLIAMGRPEDKDVVPEREPGSYRALVPIAAAHNHNVWIAACLLLGSNALPPHELQVLRDVGFRL